jgi:hypothetical protein
MANSRKKVSPKDKSKTMASEKCYVCSDLGLDHAGFDGYDASWVHYDHYQSAFGNVGGGSPITLPIHGAPRGSTPDDPGFEASTRRNCHAGRRNDFDTRSGYVAEVRARMQIRTVNFIDDVEGNLGRDPTSNEYNLPVAWSEHGATFVGKEYPVVEEERRGKRWRRFLTTARPNQVFTDDKSQVRPGAKKTLSKMVHTFLADGFPMFAPVNARVDPCGHLVIFDGNHRATSHALAFGVDAPMPVMIWAIAASPGCAIRKSVLPTRTSGKKARRGAK